jgi:arthrofactin-type cyclic lipopeptide synthetase C
MELCLAADVSPRFDAQVLETSLQNVLVRHQELLATFHLVDDELVVECLGLKTFGLHVVDLESATADEVRASLDAAVEHGFPSLREPLLRLTVFLTADNHNIILLQVHHIIADGWSLEIIFRDLMTSYLAGGTDVWTSGSAARFEDFVQSPEGQAHHAYWLSHLSGMTGAIDLPFRHDAHARSDDRALIEKIIDIDVKAGLTEFARRANISRFALLLGILGLALDNLAGRQYLPISIPVARRNRKEHMELVGDVAQTVYVGLDASLRDNPPAYFKDVASRLETALAHQDYPIRRVTSEIRANAVDGARVNDQIVFGMTAPQKNDVLDIGKASQGTAGRKVNILGYSVEFLHVARIGCPRELCIRCQLDDDSIRLQIAYDTSLFQRSGIQSLADAFHSIASSLPETAPLIAHG